MKNTDLSVDKLLEDAITYARNSTGDHLRGLIWRMLGVKKGSFGEVSLNLDNDFLRREIAESNEFQSFKQRVKDQLLAKLSNAVISKDIMQPITDYTITRAVDDAHDEVQEEIYTLVKEQVKAKLKEKYMKDPAIKKLLVVEALQEDSSGN